VLFWVGYKLRETVWRALKTRGKAIRSALDKYNRIAPLMEPPAPQLDWNQLMDYTFVSEFELLKYSQSHKDVTTEPWSLPSNREMTTKYFKILRAKEEIFRVNIEARRLRTSIRDEHIMFERHIMRLRESQPLLAAEIRQQYVTRRHVNATHSHCLDAIEDLPEFTGIRGPGIRHGTVSADCAGASQVFTDGSPDERAHMSAAEQSGNEPSEDQDDDGTSSVGQEDLREQVIGLTEAVAKGIPDDVYILESMLFNWTV
jgi:hypothetical protein